MEGFISWDAWDRALASGAGGSGRGVSAVVPGSATARWRLKRMRRGGLAARLWSDRYPSAERLVAVVEASATALARGVPTARPVALIVERGAAGLVLGALAFEEIEETEDLAKRVTGGLLTRAELSAAIAVVRTMHDAGIVHPDLNLGNILLRVRPGARPEAFVIDFDKAEILEGPAPFADRQAALRRLERSCAKLIGAPGPLGDGGSDLWYSIYAGDDAELAKRFVRGRGVGRMALAVHRLGWKRRDS
jgi:tRNA A-37 threonylcarbamoyl transferase component Bud32